jgi:L-ascorbate metabolism protein UlaG (beta-lactamase superfamily)
VVRAVGDGVTADLLLVTHEHQDHNGVGAVGGDPVVLVGGGPAIGAQQAAEGAAFTVEEVLDDAGPVVVVPEAP